MKEFSKGNDPKAWEREANALATVGRWNLSHVVGVKAMFTKASIFYLMLPWADGGNLMDFWKRHDSYQKRRSIAGQSIRGILWQLREISQSLEFLHDFKRNGKASYRHGDLKPENILVFWANETKEDVPGTWKMADFGLAKKHEEVTGERNNMKATSIRGWGTISYKPPEVFSNKNSPTSRLFDIWSMGCIILQLITWLIDGIEGVKKLTRKTTSHLGDMPSCFWDGDYHANQGWSNITVHDEVTKLISELKTGLKASPALLDLLAVVETQLLVIKRPHPGDRGEQQCRTDAHGLLESLQKICRKCQKDRAYWEKSAQVVRWSVTPPQVQHATQNGQQGMNAQQGLIAQKGLNVQQGRNVRS